MRAGFIEEAFDRIFVTLKVGKNQTPPNYVTGFPDTTAHGLTFFHLSIESIVMKRHGSRL